ncbi:MFS transporter [Micromonospora sp. RTP1Z1]|uniref:MFS transporter n=1 Tax=Micromonospora sp. RTP1Z1 TaxID=2994043 RepID=UPI0029C7E213|nr:MFS transporter [Micromonospora sp. RTP1Z1]
MTATVATAGPIQKGLGRDFNLLWAGQTVSNIGDRINLFVVPTVMILLLNASAFQVGLVGMAQYLAIPLLSLVAGVLVDRWDLRRTLVWCDVIRFAVIAAIPLAYWLGVLSVPLLFVCVAVANATAVFFNIGYTATISAIVPVEGRVRAYSRLETSRTSSEVVGPAIASGLYSLLGLAALLVDAASFLVSAASIKAMRPYGATLARKDPMWTRLMAGIRLNWQDRVLRGTLIGTLLLNCGGPIFVTVLPILAYRGLGLSVVAFGTAMSVAAAAAVVGALLAQRANELIGPARMMPWAVFLHCFVGLGVLLAPALPPVIVLGLTLSFYGVFMVWYNVSTAAVRQARVPSSDQAVSHAAFRTVTWGVIPFAALAGGVLVDALTGQFGTLNAAKITMVAGTMIGVLFAWIPLAPSQRRLDREAAQRRAEMPAEVAA